MLTPSRGEALRERLDRLRSGGATEVMWQPMGPEVPPEMHTFVEATGL